ncbi:MAG: RimK family alpha-L-glutamate ligase [Dehalococcoidales bacterium]|nr:RimK family alpha-L-glutamate ligase [Dehalococcoidales bacterium]
MKEFRIGIVSSDPNGWHTGQLLAAATKVARAEVLNPLDATVRVGGLDTGVWFGSERAGAFAAILLRGLHEEGLADFQLEAYRIVEDTVPIVVNRVGPILTALDKGRTTYLLDRAGVRTPPTVITQRESEAQEAVRRFGEAVVKPLYGSLGEDIVRAKADPEGRRTVAQMVRRFGAVYVQRFEPPGGRDIRAFVVGGEVVAAIYRVAREGEWITNVFRGATAEPIRLSAEMSALAVKAAKVVGLDYTGVDLIETSEGPTVIEVNGTPSWMGVDAAWHRSMAEEVIGFVRRKVLERMRADPAFGAAA